MPVALLLCVLALAPAPAVAAGQQKRLAVLELNAQRLAAPDRASFQAPYFTDLLRQKAVQLLPRLGVITRENLLTLLQASGRDISQCEGSCAVETARMIGADYVIAGDFSRVGNAVKLTLTLYDARTGNVLAGTTAAGKNPEGLDESAQLVADDLFTPLVAQFGGPPPLKAVAAKSGSPRAHKVAIGLLIASGVLAATSGGFAYAGSAVNGTIQSDRQATNTAVADLYSSGKRDNGIALISAAGAGLLLLIGVPLFFATAGSGP